MSLEGGRGRVGEAERGYRATFEQDPKLFRQERGPNLQAADGNAVGGSRVSCRARGARARAGADVKT